MMIDQMSQEHPTTKQLTMMTAITIQQEHEHEPLAGQVNNNNSNNHLFSNHRDHNNNNNNNNSHSHNNSNSNSNGGTQDNSMNNSNDDDDDDDDDDDNLAHNNRHRVSFDGPQKECPQREEKSMAAAAARRRASASSVMRQLGRRVSLFPQVFARQLTITSGQQQQRDLSVSPLSEIHIRSDSSPVRSERFSDNALRRCSLPVGVSATPTLNNHQTCNECFLKPIILGGADAAAAAAADDDEVDSRLRQQQVVEVPTTVAGVGGTITTVTRSKRKTAPLPRLVAKNGQVNLFLDNIDRRQYMRDLFTTMIDIKWRYNLMAAAFGFVFSWLFFACIWYIVLYVHNDLEHENDPNWSPCIVNVHSFPAALLFSIETQSTLGFGSRIISVECPGAILIFCSQLIFGVVVECLIVGMVFAKLSRPTKRSQTIMYSKYATICLREGKMCLTFRVGDVRSKSHIIGATLRASLVSSKITAEGEIIPFYHHKLKVITDDCKNSLLLIWPVTIVHIIDETSPFYKLNADELINFKFEIITVLEGTVESTGQSIQVRSSYLPSEVKWGYRFEPIVSTHGYGKYAQTIIDYNKFNRVIEVATPKCSPMDYYADQQLVGLSETNTTTTTNSSAGNNLNRDKPTGAVAGAASLELCEQKRA